MDPEEKPSETLQRSSHGGMACVICAKSKKKYLPVTPLRCKVHGVCSVAGMTSRDKSTSLTEKRVTCSKVLRLWQMMFERQLLNEEARVLLTNLAAQDTAILVAASSPCPVCQLQQDIGEPTPGLEVIRSILIVRYYATMSPGRIGIAPLNTYG